ncbi:MAG: hypothetical protein LKF52_12020 [Butyrivibrio sp.]|jgi:hypothetical protein|nr:hypothetical protein [Butyrivibrio sp.]
MSADEMKNGTTETDTAEDAKLCAGGYHFLTEEDAEKANIDARKIEYIKSHVNFNSLEGIQAVYEKAIENRIFKTPVGWNYLNELRSKMLELGAKEEDMTPIPLLVAFSHAPLPDDYIPRQRIQRMPEKRKFPVLTLSITMNAVMIALVIAMFMIANTSDTDNIMNYKRNVMNRYASWDQEISDREQAVREKERQLGISGAETSQATEEISAAEESSAAGSSVSE